MDRACCMQDIHCNIADLAEAMGALVKPHEFGNHACGLGAEATGRNVRGKWRCVLAVFEERAEEMDVEELEEHAEISLVRHKSCNDNQLTA